MARVGEIQVGEVTYNGYTFDGAFHVEVSAQDVLDESGRVVKYSEYTMTVHAIIADSAGTAEEMADIHKRLSKSGERLVVTDIGLGGALNIGGTSRREVLYGPIPKVRTWKPIGSSRACQVSWSVTFRLAECGDVTNIRGVIEANYTVKYSIDQHGNSSRTISGSVIVVNNIIGRRVTENPELFRTWIGGVIPLGWKRTQQYSLNAAKNKVDFTLTDTEVPTHHNAIPPGLSDARGSHRISWALRKGATLNNSMSFTLTPNPDVPQSYCWLIALQIVDQRMKIQRAASACEGIKGGTLINSYSIKEDIWGRPVEISISWIHTINVEKVITDSGIFVSLPVAMNDWVKWRKEMTSWGHHPFGNAKLKWYPQDDYVNSLCNQNPIVLNGAVATYPVQKIEQYGIANQLPPPKNSYLSFDQVILPLSNRPTAIQAILQPTDDMTGNVDMNDTENPQFGGGQGPSESGRVKAVIQQSTKAIHKVIVMGRAKRAGYPVPKPKLPSYNGQKLIETKAAFTNTLLRNALGVPIYSAEWIIEYALGGAIGEVKPEPNVKEKVDSDGKACKPDETGTR